MIKARVYQDRKSIKAAAAALSSYLKLWQEENGITEL
jgi:hypothetical protein